MKDPYGLIDSGLPPELVAQLMGAGSRQKIAEAMMASSMTPVENMGGPGAKVSWTQGLAKIADALVAGRDMSNYDKVYGDVAQQAQAGRKAAMEQFQRTRDGAPGVTPLTPNDDEGNAMPSSPAVPGDRRKAIEDAYANAYLAKSPFLKMEQASYERDINREDQQAFLKDQKKMQLEQRAHDIQMQAQARLDQIREAAEQNRITREEADKRAAAVREDMIRLTAALRPPGTPSHGTIVNPEDPKQMILIDTKLYKGGGLGAPGVIGVAGKEPAAAKQAEAVDVGRENVSKVTAELRTLYDKLDKNKGITNPDNSLKDNLFAGLRSSAAGQAAGKIIGTQDQSDRNTIVQARPLLMQAIMKATGMTSKQLDSNAELKLWLATATDPTLDVKSNKAALDRIEQMFGMGSGSLGGSKPADNVPTATGPNGQKLYLRNGQWVPQ